MSLCCIPVLPEVRCNDKASCQCGWHFQERAGGSSLPRQPALQACTAALTLHLSVWLHGEQKSTAVRVRPSLCIPIGMFSWSYAVSTDIPCDSACLDLTRSAHPIRRLPASILKAGPNLEMCTADVETACAQYSAADIAALPCCETGNAIVKQPGVCCRF